MAVSSLSRHEPEEAPAERPTSCHSCVAGSFLLMTICLGIGYSFGIYQAHYRFVAFPESSDLVRA